MKPTWNLLLLLCVICQSGDSIRYKYTIFVEIVMCYVVFRGGAIWCAIKPD